SEQILHFVQVDNRKRDRVLLFRPPDITYFATTIAAPLGCKVRLTGLPFAILIWLCFGFSLLSSEYKTACPSESIGKEPDRCLASVSALMPAIYQVSPCRRAKTTYLPG